MNKTLYANKPRTRIRPISHARAGRLKEYARLKRAWAADKKNQVCHFPGCTSRAEKNPHHLYGRVGWLLNAVEHWRAVCLTHHRFIHDHPDQAREKGMLAPRGQWLNPPKAKAS
jgi:hypothetical protein